MLCAGMVSTPLFAQTPSLPDAGSLLRDIESIEPALEAPAKLGSQLPPALPDKGQSVVLKEVHFDNYQSMATDKQLQNIVQHAIGKPIGFNGLMHLADLVTEYLKNQGYFLAFAYLPEQDITEGKVLISIQPGRIEGGSEWQPSNIENSGVDLSKQRIINTFNNALKPDQDDVVHTQQLERGLLIINDLSGISATSSLEKGQEFGTTRVGLNIKSTPRYSANAWLDNYGNYYTGDKRINAMGFVNNVSGIGDELVGMLSLTEFMNFGRIGYSAPVGYSGLTASSSLSLMQYELGNLDLGSNTLDGNSVSFNAGMRYPLIRSRVNNLYTSFNYDYRLLRDYQNDDLDKHREYQTLTVGLNGDKIDRWYGGGLTNYYARLTFGDLDRSGQQQDYEADQLGADTQGQFHKLTLGGARLQKINDQMTFLIKGAIQTLASDNLDSSEEISISGVNGVRAYAPGDASGDEGWHLTLEAKYAPEGVSMLNGNLQFSAFYDTGMITNIDKKPWDQPTNSAGVNSYQISGAGLGMTWTQPQKYSVKASYAQKINDKIEERKDISTGVTDSEGKDRGGRFWLQAMWWF